MIECSSEYIWYKKRRKFKLKKFFAFFYAFLFVLSTILYFKFFISEQVYKFSFDYAYKYCTESVNNAVFDTLNSQVKYSDLVIVDKNSEGNIVLISANSHKVNYLTREIIRLTDKQLESKLNNGVPVPIFAFTGIGIVSGLGKPVNLKTLSVSSVECEFNSTFSSVGINQTLHSIYVKIKCEVQFSIPLKKSIETHESSVLISENILVGKVPDIYLNGKIFQ